MSAGAPADPAAPPRTATSDPHHHPLGQQGLFVIGGALTDRYGPRPVVLAGCVLRIAGFGWLAFAGSTATVVCAVLLTGLAGALFSRVGVRITPGKAVGRL